MNTENTKKNSRLAFIDLMRGFALLVMIEVHIVNALLRPEVTGEIWFPFLNFINGLVAPSFLFISGFSFTISFKHADPAKFRKALRKRAGRILLIFIVGYSLHTPSFSLTTLLQKTDNAGLQAFFNVDILQCIGAGLLILLVSRILISSVILYRALLIVLLCAVVFAAPCIWNIDFTGSLPAGAASFMNEQTGSFFPFFPWAGFIFAGSLTASLYISSAADEKTDIFMKGLFLSGAAAAAAGLAAVLYMSRFESFQVRPSPLFFAERFGFVLVMLYLTRHWSSSSGNIKTLISKIGRESLPVYWLHLQLIYRKFPGGKSLAESYGAQFSIIQCFSAALFMIAAMIIFAVLWSEIKKKYPEASKISVRLFITAALAVFSLT